MHLICLFCRRITVSIRTSQRHHISGSQHCVRALHLSSEFVGSGIVHGAVCPSLIHAARQLDRIPPIPPRPDPCVIHVHCHWPCCWFPYIVYNSEAPAFDLLRAIPPPPPPPPPRCWTAVRSQDALQIKT